MTLSYNLAYQEIILVHPTGRQIFAGKPYFTFWNIWEWVIYRHTSLVLTQFHLKPSSTKLYWPSTTKYQPVRSHIDPAPPNADPRCLLLTQYYNVSSSSASYKPNKHHISTHTAIYWPSTTKCQPVQPHTDPAPPITNLYRLLLTKYHHVSTSSSPYWPSTTKYEPVPPHTDPVPPNTNQ